MALSAPTLIIPATATARSPVQYAWHQGGLYARWECTLAGTVVGAGVTFAGGASGIAGIAGLLAGGSFTAGCELGAPNNAYYINGVPPWSGGNGVFCWDVFPRDRHGRTSPYRRLLLCAV